jgi:hypothetical protein
MYMIPELQSCLVAEVLVGEAVHSVGEEGQMVAAGVVRAAAVDEVDFQVLQEGAIVGTKTIPQILILEADTHQVVYFSFE